MHTPNVVQTESLEVSLTQFWINKVEQITKWRELVWNEQQWSLEYNSILLKTNSPDSLLQLLNKTVTLVEPAPMMLVCKMVCLVFSVLVGLNATVAG